MTRCVRLQLIPYSRHINRVVQHRTVALAKARGLLPAKQEVPHPSRSNVNQYFSTVNPDKLPELMDEAGLSSKDIFNLSVKEKVNT